jgi:hypothetical protein
VQRDIYGKLLNYPLHIFNNYSTTLHTFTIYRTTLHVIRAIIPTTPATDKEFTLGLAAICNYILLLVLTFIADLCVDAAREATLLTHRPRLVRDFSRVNRLLVAKFQRSHH